jgi:LCP family protein required for cell wall assembly
MPADTARRGGRPADAPRARPPTRGLRAEDRLLSLGGRSRQRWPRRALITANALVLALLALGASAIGYVEWRLGQINRIKVAGLVRPVGGPLTILAVGSDTRDLGKGDQAAFGNAQQVTGHRSDTIMLIRVVPTTASVALLSIPRDLLVPIPGMGITRINAAFDSGPDLLVRVIEQDLGLQVNHFMVVNFYTFTQLADSLGGVYQYFPTPARDLWSGLTVPHAGCFLLKGSEALGFVRSREYQYYLDGSWQYQLVPESDLARIQRQQAFVKLAIRKAEHVAPTNPVALNSILAGVTGSLTVDSGFSNSLMLQLAVAMRHVHASAIPEWTYPTVNSVSVPGALDPVPSADQQMLRQFLDYGLPTAPKANASARVAPSSAKVGAVSAVPVRPAPAVLTVRNSGPTVSPDSSSYYQGEYVPPGLQPGQVPERCPL